ncbi:MAG: Mfa1 family fimbria major subunit [Bacteroides sp.]|nr:Mfa1 family fimbria major subunit [Bacteroides sp.]MCM1389353.1 Mfa1 family fimbria major subunit [Bacteroides sp.]
MKKAKLLYGALAMLAFNACSDDNSPKGGEENADGYKQYISVEIATSNVSGRALDDDENGDNFIEGDAAANENTIKKLQFVFYGPSGNVVASKSVDINDGDYVSDKGNVEGKIEKKVEFTVPAGSVTPTQLMVYANPINSGDVNNPLPNIVNSTRDSYKTTIDGTECFTMNNSVYYSEGTGKKGSPVSKLQRAVAISGDNIASSEDELASKTAVEVYIERIAAKVQVATASDMNNATLTYKDGNNADVNIKFVIDGWGVTATNKKAYVTKQLPEDGNVTVNSFDWNDPTHHRSYWARGYGFTVFSESDFPTISDDVQKWASIDATTATNDNSANYPLNYNSYKSIKENNVNSVYVLENTQNQAIQNGTSRSAALTSAIVVGHYVKVDGTSVGSTGETFYNYAGSLYFGDNMLKFFANQQSQIFVDYIPAGATESTMAKPTEEQLADIFEIKHVTGQAENVVALQLKGKSTNANKFYKKTTEGKDVKYVQIATDELVAEMNEALVSSLGTAQAYTDGMAYFPVIIEHLGAKGTGDNADPAGAYGVVRNHIYQITIDGIEGLGIGVYNWNQPIVPPTPSKELRIKASINALSWKLVDQHTILGKK